MVIDMNQVRIMLSVPTRSRSAAARFVIVHGGQCRSSRIYRFRVLTTPIRSRCGISSHCTQRTGARRRKNQAQTRTNPNGGKKTK